MKIDFSKFKLVIFDLDNTLFDENIYLFAGYAKIACYLSAKYPHIPQNQFREYLDSTFINEGRINLFGKLFDKFGLKNELENCLDILRKLDLTEKIQLYEKSFSMVRDAVECTSVCILTNGNPQQQKNKIKHLDFKGLLSLIEVIYANEFSPKPSEIVFSKYISQKYDVKPQDVIVIGDSYIDQQFAESIGSSFFNITNIMI